MSELITQEQPEVEEDGLLAVLPGYLKDKIGYLQPAYLEATEEELERSAFDGPPDIFGSRLKLNFWEEYDAAKKSGRVMQTTKIVYGVCTPNLFKKFIDDKWRLAWLIRIPPDYKLSLADIHDLSLAQMREIMTMDNYDPKGQPNTKLLEVKFKVAQHVDMRLKGAIIQRIDQRNLNMNVNANADTAARPEDVALSMDEIENRLTQLKRKSASLLAPGGVQVDLLSAITAEPDTIDVDASPNSNRGIRRD